MGRQPTLRALRPADEPEVLALLAVAMGWAWDAAHAAFFRWKHYQNPFGSSPGWVAEVDGEIVGLRLFMRWRFCDGERSYRAVRAVDTATHPAHRGRGIFRDLTTHALGALAEDGVDFVFNTPNEQSKPGYLQMGWEEVGRLPVSVKVRSMFALPRMLRSRVAADREPLPTEAGIPAVEAFRDPDRLPDVVPEGALTTPRSTEFLRWRYGLPQLGYRAWEPPSGGVVFFRLRRRGRARELVFNDLLLPPHAERARIVARLVKTTRADYGLRIPEPGSVEGELAPPGLGPVLVWRGLQEDRMPPLDRWRLSMGDIELF